MNKTITLHTESICSGMAYITITSLAVFHEKSN